MNGKVRYTTTQRGACKAVHGGYMYMYTLHREVKLGASWRCELRGKCNGRMVVGGRDYVVADTETSHSFH
ncbi:hypothetical protein KUF71_016234 [Frankliniella fusca]|uniref:FLYWCH-type domain-containing protein n=1 Tax=Frankliniella fusca TaxID=407009 RepID=A0AAE1LR89_9NEOP|nr:hypothetical protein KUF71_016234 [Frankliniella fusca]